MQKSKHLVTVAVDPGAQAGIATIANGQVVHVDECISDVLDVGEKQLALIRALRAGNVPLTASGRVVGKQVSFVVEDQYVHHPQAAMAVVGQAVAWKVLAKILGLRLAKPVPPSRWQSTFGLATGKKRTERGAELLHKHYPRLISRADNALLDKTVAVLIGIHHQVKSGQTDGLEWVRMERAEYEARRDARSKKRNNRKGSRK